MNLLKAFGIQDATDKMCDDAGIEKVDWLRMTDETIAEIGEADVKNDTCIKCGEETGWGFTYCSSCRV
jgi:hypothetical protein